MPPAPVVFQPNSLDSLGARLDRWARERLDADVKRDAINDAIEALWMAVSLATLNKFVSRPVQQFIPAQSQSFQLVSVADPAAVLVMRAAAGGALPPRSYALTYTYVTDSGSETLPAPSATLDLGVNALASALPPLIVPDALGWNLYCDSGNGRKVLQNAQPLPFSTTWIESPLGVAQDGPYPPSINSTGDNIASISRLDVVNPDQSFTSWTQTDIASSTFSLYQNRYPLASTYPRHAFDFLGNRTVEFRPMAGTDLDATLFYVVRPRRLRYGNSRLPFTAFPSESFLANSALADILGSLGEDDGASRCQAKAEKDLLAIMLSVTNESWNQNKSVRPYLRFR